MALESVVAERFVDVLNVRFQRITTAQAVEQMLHWIAEKTRRMVITAGPEFVMVARDNPVVRKIAESADLVTADGIGVVWAAKRSGRPVPERVTGVELVLALLDESARRNQPLRVYIFGARQWSLESCLQHFRTTYPEMVFRGHNGYVEDTQMPALLADIKAFAPDLWLVGLGQPRQEQFIYEHLASLPPCVAIGVGGSIDIWGGTLQRAPLVFRKMNLEWFYRLVRQPARWRRQLVLPKFALTVLVKRDRRSIR